MALIETGKSISEVTELLRDYLETRLRERNISFGAAGGVLDVGVGRPEPPKDNGQTSYQRRLNLFLYEAVFDPSLKNVPLDEGQPEPLWLVLKYLMTAFDEEENSDSLRAHEMLGEGIRALQELSYLVLKTPPSDALKDNPEVLKITFDESDVDLLSKLMQGSDEKYRFSFCFQVRPVMIATAEPPSSSLLVGVDYTSTPVDIVGEEGVQIWVSASPNPQISELVHTATGIPDRPVEVGDSLTIHGSYLKPSSMLGDQLIALCDTGGGTMSFTAPGADPTTATELKLDSGSSARVVGRISGNLSSFPSLTNPPGAVDVTIGGVGIHTATMSSRPTTLDETRTRLQKAINDADDDPAFTKARVFAYMHGGDERLVVLAGTPGLSVSFSAAAGDATTVTELQLDNASSIAVNGVVSGDLSHFPTLTSDPGSIDVSIGGGLPDTITFASRPGSLAQLRDVLEQGIHGVAGLAQARIIAYTNTVVRFGQADLCVTSQQPDMLRCLVNDSIGDGLVISAGSHPVSVVHTLPSGRKRQSNLMIGKLAPTLDDVTFTPNPGDADIMGTLLLTGTLLGGADDDIFVLLYQDGEVVKSFHEFAGTTNQRQLSFDILTSDDVAAGRYRIILRVNGQQAKNSPERDIVP